MRFGSMPRLPRLFVPELPAHITLRGNNRQDIFRCDGDRSRFLGYLRDAAANHGVGLHAYVLMTNHVHLLATATGKMSTPRTIQSVGRQYVAYFNERYQRTGTLWEGRYRSTLVDADKYLFACHRYIDLNPVRSGLASHPARYPWSSHRFYAYGNEDDLVTPHPVVLALGTTPERRHLAYRALFDHDLEAEVLQRIRFCSNQGWALGSERFCESLERSTQRQAASRGVGWAKGRKRGPRKAQ
jgi:putative transposase